VAEHATDQATEPDAFAKARTYLNYRPSAMWTSYLAGGFAAVLFLLQFIVLWAFVDLLVFCGRFPSFHTLPGTQQEKFIKAWNSLSPTERKVRLLAVLEPEPIPENTKPEDREAAEKNAREKFEQDVLALSKKDASREMDRNDLDGKIWRAQLGSVLTSRVSENLISRVHVPPRGSPDYDEVNNGLLSLVVRDDASSSWLTPVVSWLASWNRWTWDGTRSVLSAYLLGLLILSLMLLLAGSVSVWLSRYMAAVATIEASTQLRRTVYRHSVRLGTLAFRALGPAEAVTVFARHLEAVHDGLYAHLTSFYREPLIFVLLLIFALILQPWLALSFLLFAVFIWLVGTQVILHYRRQGRVATNAAAERLTIMRESLMMMRLVKCYVMETFNQSRVERQLAGFADVQMQRLGSEAVSRPLLFGLGMACVLILMFAAGLIVLSGQMGVAGVVTMTAALVCLYGPVERWLETRRVIHRANDAAVQVFKFLDRRSEVGQVVGAQFLEPVKKVIEFDNVTLREPGSNRLLLEEVSLTIPARQRVGIIGSDDLEKHALVYLIPRLLDPSQGEIRIDSHNLRFVTLDSLREQIATVLQHNLVFHDTVANNIGCGDPGYTLPQIIEAAKQAHAHHFIQKLPQGYETAIGELGHPLSTSQQFRIALARAILRDPALIIIEEPQSELDDDTKALLDDSLARILPGRTCIFLPHRIKTIRSCDKLILVHKGKVVATGIHKELLATNPLYRHLHYLEFNEIDD
jgi:ATP-binding cassette subfamily B protein